MATCYDLNGTQVDDPSQRPCPLPPGQKHGMCCATARQQPDYCTAGSNFQPPGLCLSPYDSYLYRDGCTDPNWGPDCLKICASGLADQGIGNTVNLCGDGTYCCGKDIVGISCCKQGDGFYIVNNTNTTIKPTSLSNYGATITLPAVTISSTPTPAKSQRGAIAGGTVGGFVLGLLLGCLILFFYNRVRPPSRRPDKIPRHEKVDQPVESDGHPIVVAEASRNSMAAELGGSVPPRFT